MQEKKLVRFLVAIAVAGFLGVLSMQDAVGSNVINLRYASYQPHTSDSYKAQQWWVNEVEKRSGNKVKITMFPGEQLVKAAEMLETASSGGADIVGAAAGYTPGDIPIHNLLYLPMLVPERLDQQMMIFNSDELRNHPAMVKELNSHNVVNLYTLVVPPYCLASSRRVASGADFQGLKLRTTGLLAELLKKFGATSVFTSAPETMMAMSRGVVDAATCAGDYWIKAYKIDEASRYITRDVVFGGASLDILMNKTSYDKLPAEVKKIINDLRDEMTMVVHLHLTGPDKLLKWHMENERKGITYVYWKKEHVKELEETAVSIWDEWKKKFRDRGSEDYFVTFLKKKEEVLTKYPDGLPIQYKY